MACQCLSSHKWSTILQLDSTCCLVGIELADDTIALLIYWRMWWRHAHIRLLIFCVVTQQTATFWGVGTEGGDYDTQIRTQMRFLYSAPNHQVSSSYTESFGSYYVDKHPNKQTPLKTSTSLHYAMQVGNKWPSGEKTWQVWNNTTVASVNRNELMYTQWSHQFLVTCYTVCLIDCINMHTTEQDVAVLAPMMPATSRMWQDGNHCVNLLTHRHSNANSRLPCFSKLMALTCRSHSRLVQFQCTLS